MIARDSRERFRFASLQSPVAAQLLAAEPPGWDQLESVILVEGGRVYRKSTAALRTARWLDGPWLLLSLLLVVPRPLRDAVYDWFGNRRYRMFGKRDVCWAPEGEISNRFIA